MMVRQVADDKGQLRKGRTHESIGKAGLQNLRATFAVSFTPHLLPSPARNEVKNGGSKMGDDGASSCYAGGIDFRQKIVK